MRLEIVDGEASPGPERLCRLPRCARGRAGHGARRQRPDESLGVITSGMKHQARVEQALREALRERPELGRILRGRRRAGRRFFVKNMENVQGDERDAIILSVGVARKAAGKIR